MIPDNSVQNYTYKYKLYCDRQYIQVTAAMMIFGVGSGINMIIMLLSDRFGRKITNWVGFMLSIVGLLGVGLIENVWGKIVAYSVSFAGCDTLFSLTFLFINEQCGQHIRKTANAWIFVAFGSASLVVNAICFLVTDSDMLVWVLLIASVSGSVCFFYVLETPFYYF